MECDNYICHYCVSPFFIYEKLIDHLCQRHPEQDIKYRQKELNHETGKFGYQTKLYPNCRPGDKTITVTADKRLCILNADRTKRKKVNTPKKVCSSAMILSESSSEDEICEQDMDFQFENLDINLDKEENDISEDLELLVKLMPAVVKSLKEHNQLSTYVKWCKLIKDGRFPLNNICYMLFLDLVEWFEKPNTSQMRYFQDDTRQNKITTKFPAKKLGFELKVKMVALASSSYTQHVTEV